MLYDHSKLDLDSELVNLGFSDFFKIHAEIFLVLFFKQHFFY